MLVLVAFLTIVAATNPYDQVREQYGCPPFCKDEDCLRAIEDRRSQGIFDPCDRNDAEWDIHMKKINQILNERDDRYNNRYVLRYYLRLCLDELYEELIDGCQPICTTTDMKCHEIVTKWELKGKLTWCDFTEDHWLRFEADFDARELCRVKDEQQYKIHDIVLQWGGYTGQYIHPEPVELEPAIIEPGTIEPGNSITELFIPIGLFLGTVIIFLR